MDAITQSTLIELIMRIPAAKLQLAYRLLDELVRSEETNLLSYQQRFMQLPLAERREIMARQAEQMAEYYEKTASERLEWQSGDFLDEY